MTELSLPSYKIFAELNNRLNIKKKKFENFIYAPDKKIRKNLQKIFDINNRENSNYTNSDKFIEITKEISNLNISKYDKHYLNNLVTYEHKSAMADKIIEKESKNDDYIKDIILLSKWTNYDRNQRFNDIIITKDKEYIKTQFDIYKEICNEILNENSQNLLGEFDVIIEKMINTPEKIANKDRSIMTNQLPRPTTARPTTARPTTARPTTARSTPTTANP
jgi:hypothetical protein